MPEMPTWCTRECRDPVNGSEAGSCHSEHLCVPGRRELSIAPIEISRRATKTMRAVKDIVTTKWPGIELWEAKMNADLLTDDLKKTRWSNESFLFIGQPETTVLFYLSLPTESRAADAARHIDSLGGFIVECRDADAGWLCLATRRMSLDGRTIFEHSHLFESIAAKNDGVYDGWEAEAVK